MEFNLEFNKSLPNEFFALRNKSELYDIITASPTRAVLMVGKLQKLSPPYHLNYAMF